ADFNGKLLPEDWDRFDELLTNAIVRVPELEDAEGISLVNGPEAFTPGGGFILGESDVRGFWVAAGFCAHGLAGAGGMGRLVAEWIIEGLPSLDVWGMDSPRFGPHHPTPQHTPPPPVPPPTNKAASTPSRAPTRSTRRTTTSSTRVRSASLAARSGSPRPIRGCRSSAPASERSPGGSGRTGSSRTRPRGTKVSAPEAGRAGTGGP